MRAALLTFLLLCGCPATHSEWPSTSCKGDNDCFKGEVCVLTESGGTCTKDADGGTP